MRAHNSLVSRCDFLLREDAHLIARVEHVKGNCVEIQPKKKLLHTKKNTNFTTFHSHF